MKNVLFLVFGSSLLLPLSAFAGVLYGTVRVDSTPAAAVKIFVACPGFNRPGQSPTSVVTDARGSYSLRVPASGRCEMRVQRGDDQTGAAFEVFLSDNPLRFDFVVDGAMNRVR